MEKALAKLFFYLSLVVVANLAMRPKLSIAIAAVMCILAAFLAVDELVVLRVLLLLAAPVFFWVSAVFFRLMRDRHIVVKVDDGGLTIERPNRAVERFLWKHLSGYDFHFGVFRVLDRDGKPVLRVDDTIDGFSGLLYHVNRNTFRPT